MTGESEITSLRVNSETNQLLAGNQEGKLIFIDLADLDHAHESLNILETGTASALVSIFINSEGNLVLGFENGNVSLYSLKTFEVLASVDANSKILKIASQPGNESNIAVVSKLAISFMTLSDGVVH